MGKTAPSGGRIEAELRFDGSGMNHFLYVGEESSV